MHPKAKQSLLDAALACDRAELNVLGISLRVYELTGQVQWSTERLVEIIGEALSRADKYEPGIVDRIPNARSVISMRNRIIHGYDAIDDEVVWNAATRHAPILRKHILEVIQQDETEQLGGP